MVARDFYPWLLSQMKQQETSTGKRLLDVLVFITTHRAVNQNSDTSTAIQLLRNRSTRSLWDPNYTDELAAHLPTIQLIPALKSWINTYYLGTKTAITEYNWGAEGHISGATAQADVLASCRGRSGYGNALINIDPSQPLYKAIKLYRNYDGAKSAFGDTSVSTAVPNPDELAAFGAIRLH